MGNLCSVTLSVDQLVSGCIKSTARHATYMFKPARNLESLRTAMEDLKAMKVDVIRKVEAAERQKMKRLKQVELWLSRVERVENEVDDLMNIILLPRKCIWGSCPNCYSNHKLATRIVKCLTEVDGLKTKGQFDEVAEHLHSQVDELPAEPTVGAESKFAHIWKSITEDKIGIVGIYGMGGVGKTTLLKQVNNKFANTSHEFDHVIWVTVSKDFNAEKVQQEIWKKIGRRFGPEKSFEEKAVDIFRILKNEKFVLLLDDIWERIDLAQLGVPLPSRKSEANHVLFTTRSKEVCGLMEAHDKIEVGCLSPEKAWELFSEKVGEQTLNLHPDIPRLGKIVAQECGGLPLALITIARVMASRSTPEEWSRTANVLRNSASRFSEMGEKVFSLLKFSYDNLPDDNIKSCLLYCALFPEDYEISRNHLIELWMGEDMLHDYENIDEAIGEGYGIIGTLVNACLLEWCRENYLKMHDVIRDMALWITSKPGSANGNFLVRARVGLIKVPEVNKWENIKRMSLIDNKIEKLIGAPRCPHLLTLFLRNNGLQMIDDCFFEHMHSLKVLDLFGNPNLRKLPSGISNLVSLQYLNLFDTGVKMFTIQLINLANLKCLFMEQEKEYCSASTEVLQSISKLQVLRMVKRKSSSRNHDDEWEDNSGSGLVADLKYLKNLIQLRMAVENSSTLESFFRLFQLQSCVVHIDIKHFRGVRFIDIESMGYLRGLSITDCESLEEIDVDGTWGAIETEASSNLCYQMPKESRFYNLRSVHISSCYQLRDATWLVYAQFLEVLVIYRCDKMEEVICSEKLDRAQEMVKDLLPFANLQRLDISYLNNLTSIYRTALPFERLQEININGCPKLKKLPLNYHSANVSLRRIYGQQEWWSQLEWEDETAQDVFSLYFFSHETY